MLLKDQFKMKTFFTIILHAGKSKPVPSTVINAIDIYFLGRLHKGNF